MERLQIKWFIYAGSFASVTNAASAMSGVVPAMALWTLPAAVGVAVLRYRLYEIDRLINRTLVYGLLTALIALAYSGMVLVLGQAFGGIAERPPGWAVAGTTLTVAALAAPARRGIQRAVDRRFNRRRYDAQQTSSVFSARLREQIDLDTLTAELLAVTVRAVEPTIVSLWLRSPAPRDQLRSA